MSAFVPFAAGALIPLLLILIIRLRGARSIAANLAGSTLSGLIADFLEQAFRVGIFTLIGSQPESLIFGAFLGLVGGIGGILASLLFRRQNPPDRDLHFRDDDATDG